MRIIPTNFEGAYLIQPEKKGDHRGAFARTFCQEELQKQGIDFTIRQANYSFTEKQGSLRGLHFQLPPKAEDKIVRCAKGAVYDVIVDLRPESATFLKWQGFELKAENLDSLLIPKGFAHGFQTLAKNVEMAYLHSEFYSPGHESGLRYNDPKLQIIWPLPIADISDRDLKHPLLTPDYPGVAL